MELKSYCMKMCGLESKLADWNIIIENNNSLSQFSADIF